MGWAKPDYSKSEIDRAGKAYVDSGSSQVEREFARTVINNWRSSHGFPLNTFQVSLREKARTVDNQSLIAQRIKRLPSIRSKLERFPDMKMSRMQDLGGARAVMSSIDKVRMVESAFKKSSHKHTLRRLDDYIDQPKSSGYRGIHMVYRYLSDRSETYNGLHVELQIRSQLQHLWATAVETVGTFTSQSLKSSVGENDWLRFFAMMGSQFAREEDSPLVPGTPPAIGDHQRELAELVKRLSVVERLSAYGEALQTEEINQGKGRFFLLELDISNNHLAITSFKDTIAANQAFDSSEYAIDQGSSNDRDAVLVSVDSVTGLRNAYPNYFLDTSKFIEKVRNSIS